MSASAFIAGNRSDVTPLRTVRSAFVIGTSFVVLYVVLAWISRFYMVRPFAITPWNPSSGLSLAFLLVFGIRYWPALAIAAISTSLLLRGMPAVLRSPALKAAYIEVHFASLAERGLVGAPGQITAMLKAGGFNIRWTDASHIQATRAGKN